MAYGQVVLKATVRTMPSKLRRDDSVHYLRVSLKATANIIIIMSRW